MVQTLHRIVLTSGLFALAVLGFCSEKTQVIDNADAGFNSAKDLSVSVLKYHGLRPDCGNPAYDPDMFKKQIQWLRQNNFETITMEHLLGWMKDGVPALPCKPFMVVFDDNYLSVYDTAYPALRQAGFVGYNFAHTKYVGVKTAWPHVSWEQINEMERDGSMITESHSVTHPLTPDIGDADVKMEVEESKATLEAKMPGKKIRYFAYPGQCIDDRVIAALKAAGYEAAMCGVEGTVHRDAKVYELPRFIAEPIPSFDPTTYFKKIAEAGLGTGKWETVTTATGCIGKDCAVILPGDGTASASWQWTPDASGKYKVSAHVPAIGPGAATKAVYAIRHKDGLSTVTVNLADTGNTGKWVDLGVYPFRKDKPAYAAVNNKADGIVAADAIRLDRVEGTKSKRAAK